MRSTKHTIFLALVLSSCTIEPVAINYGIDACAFCSMTIVDGRHSAEYVTSKGKAFKFDAIECMLGEMKRSDQQAALILVADFSSPGKLIPVDEAIIVHCEAIPSPMGAFISAFSDSSSLRKAIGENIFTLKDWNELKGSW